MFPQPLQALVPEPLVMREPVANGLELLGDQAVTAFAAVALLGDEAGIEQDAQMLRDGGPSHREVAGDGVDGLVALGQEVEHAASCRMADRFEDLVADCRRHHAGDYR